MYTGKKTISHLLSGDNIKETCFRQYNKRYMIQTQYIIFCLARTSRWHYAMMDLARDLIYSLTFLAANFLPSAFLVLAKFVLFPDLSGES